MNKHFAAGFLTLALAAGVSMIGAAPVWAETSSETTALNNIKLAMGEKETVEINWNQYCYYLISFTPTEDGIYYLDTEQTDTSVSAPIVVDFYENASGYNSSSDEEDDYYSEVWTIDTSSTPQTFSALEEIDSDLWTSSCGNSLLKSGTTYYLLARAKDYLYDSAYTKTLSFCISQVEKPALTSIASSPNPASPGDTVTITLTFAEDISELYQPKLDLTTCSYIPESKYYSDTNLGKSLSTENVDSSALTDCQISGNIMTVKYQVPETAASLSEVLWGADLWKIGSDDYDYVSYRSKEISAWTEVNPLETFPTIPDNYFMAVTGGSCIHSSEYYNGKYTYYYCLEFSEKQSDGSTRSGWRCIYCGTELGVEVTPAHEHTTKTVITKATPKKAGSIVKTCTDCGEVVTKTKIAKVSSISLSSTSYTYNGRKRKPTVSVKDSNGKTVSSENYTVSYAKGRKNVGTYKVTVTFKGKKYSGSKKLTFKINPKGTTISKLEAGKKKVTVKWKKQKTQTTGYQIQYSLKKNFKSATIVTIAKNKTTSKTISKLKAKKKYYVRIRTYKKVNGKNYYSAWSSKKAKITGK